MDGDDNQTASGGESGGETGSEREHESSGTGATESESQTGSQSDSQSQGNSELAEVKAKLAEANREAAKFRKERNEAKAALDKATEKDLSELEREKKRADAAEANLIAAMLRVRTANLKSAIIDTGVSVVDIEAASMFLNQRGVEYDEEGNPQNVKDTLDTLVKDKPWLIGAQSRTSQTSGDNNGGAGSSDEGGIHLTADELAIAKSFHMTPEDYAKYKNVHPT